jgi:hypothetical protein
MNYPVRGQHALAALSVLVSTGFNHLRRRSVPTRCFLMLFLSTTIWAQPGGRPVLRGELQIEGTDAGRDYQVDLADCTGGSAVLHGWMSGGTRFEFPDIQPGCKLLRVLSGPQRVLIQEAQVFADGSSLPLVIRVVQSEKAPEKAGIVSAEQLRHPMPEKIARVLSDANRLWQAGRVAEAGEKLRPAAARYPGIWELRLNLGIVEMKLHNFAAALEHFSKARELQPLSPAAAVASGFTLLQLHRLDEAESAARDAVTLDPRNQAARQLLAQVRAAKSRAGN